MHRGMIRRLFGVLLGLFLLTGCAQPTPSPAAIPEEEMPPPVTVPFNVSPEEQPTIERPPSLYLNPASISLEVGETATVQVWAEGVGGIYALFLEMGFDPLLVQVVDADPMAEGVQAAPGNLMGLVLENKVEGNRLVYHAAVQPDTAAKDFGTLAFLSLQAVAPGTTSLRMEQVMAQDEAGNPVPITPLADGAVTITGAAPPPMGEVSPPPAPQPTVPATPVPSGSGGIYYVVGPGENLFRIGLKFGTTARAIADANHIADPRQVQAGTMVLVPCAAPGGGTAIMSGPGIRPTPSPAVLG